METLQKLQQTIRHQHQRRTMMMMMMNRRSVSYRRRNHPRVHGMALSLLIHMQLLALLMANNNFVRSFSSSSSTSDRHQAVLLFQPPLPAIASTGRFMMDTPLLFQQVENDDDDDDDDNTEAKRNNMHYSSNAGIPLLASTAATSSSRRQTLQTTMILLLHSVVASAAAAVLPANAAPSSAADTTTTTTTDVKPSIVPAVEVLQRLRKVPVYAIVDGLGIPFMTYDSESASANGYFFLDYSNAQGVLEDAKRAYATAKEKQIEGVSDTWGDSRIVTLPLDLAMRLTVKQVSNMAQNDKSFRTIYQVLPSADDLETALRLENSVRYRQRGRVPLFYVDGFQLPDGTTPAYFSTQDLRMAWKKASNPSEPPLLNSGIQVRELSETFRAMIKPGGSDESVRNLVFVPSSDSVTVAQELRKTQVGEVYKIGKIVLTK